MWQIGQPLSAFSRQKNHHKKYLKIHEVKWHLSQQFFPCLSVHELHWAQLSRLISISMIKWVIRRKYIFLLNRQHLPKIDVMSWHLSIWQTRNIAFYTETWYNMSMVGCSRMSTRPLTIVFGRQSEQNKTALYSTFIIRCGVAHVS